MKSRLTILCFIFLFLFSSNVFAGKVIVNVWDGVEWDNIKQLYDAGKLPNAQSVGQIHHLTSNEECFNTNNEACLQKSKTCSCMKTMTMTQCAAMLTGVLADVSGVFNARHFQMIPEGLTMYEKLQSFNPNIKTAHITSKPDTDGTSTFGNIVNVVDHFFAEDAVQAVDIDEAIPLINQWWNQDFFIFVHFRESDRTGHRYGVDSEDYTNEILENDRQLGRVIQTLSEQGVLNQTKTYVLADHGFGCPRQTAHGCSPDAFIISNDDDMTDIFMVDVASFLLDDFDPPSACTYSISRTSQPFSAAGGTGSVDVTTQSECSWTATSNVPWITGTSGGSGMGNGYVDYSVELNPGSSRTGTMTVAGRTFTVDQSAAGLSITVTSPNDGTEKWQTGTIHMITWTYTGNPGSYVKIVLLKSGVFYGAISTATLTANGSFSWTIPSKVVAANNYRIKIISTTKKSFTDTSDNDFSIVH